MMDFKTWCGSKTRVVNAIFTLVTAFFSFLFAFVCTHDTLLLGIRFLFLREGPIGENGEQLREMVDFSNTARVAC